MNDHPFRNFPGSSSANSTVTQPIQVDETRNVRRAQQITSLHQEFQDLKKKIKEVQNKNEKIIQKLHQDYNFKKKGSRVEEYAAETSPVIYYERQDRSQLDIAENVSNKSDQSECDFKINKKVARKTSNIPNKRNGPPIYNQSMEYRRTENLQSKERQTSEVGSSKSNNAAYMRQTPQSYLASYTPASQYIIPQSEQYQFGQVNPFQMSLQYPPYANMNPNMINPMPPIYQSPSPNIGSTLNPTIYQLEETLKAEREKIQMLQKELSEKTLQTHNLKKIQKKFANYSSSIENILENSFQEFMEQVVKKNLHEIEKSCKRNENKLRNLTHKIRDREEERHSNRLINEHRKRRSGSKSKRDSSPQPPIYSTQSTSLKNNKRNSILANDSQSQIKASEIAKKNKQFQEIAAKYEEIIRVKNLEIEMGEKRLKAKEMECNELMQQYNALSKKLGEVQQKLGEVQQSKVSSQLTYSQNSDKEENLLKDDEDELLILRVKSSKIESTVRQLEAGLQQRILQLKQKDLQIDQNCKKIEALELKLRKSQADLAKSKEDQINSKSESDLASKIRKFEQEISLRESQLNEVRERSRRFQGECLEKDCQNVTLANKLGKLQAVLKVKEEKIDELQKMLSLNSEMSVGDILERSMCSQPKAVSDIAKLKEDLQHFQEELEEKKKELFILSKSKDLDKIKMAELEKIVTTLKIENEELLTENDSLQANLRNLQQQKSKQINTDLSEMLNDGLESQSVEENEAERLQEELDQLSRKYDELQKLTKGLKNENLDATTKAIKLNSEINYLRDALSEREQKYEKSKKELEECKAITTQLNQLIAVKESELEVERKYNQEKIREIEAQWLQFEQEAKGKLAQEGEDSHEYNQLRASRNFSEQSSLANYKNTYKSLSAQNEYLTEKLKEAEATIQTHNLMQEKVINEYKNNVDRIMLEVKEKSKAIEHLAEENEKLKRKVRSLEEGGQRLRRASQRQPLKDAHSFDQDRDRRIQQLEKELYEEQDLNKKLADVEQSLFQQIAQRQEEKNDALKVIQLKNQRIQELEELIELKEMNLGSHLGSHISSSGHNKSKIRESMRSQSSLRYSLISHANKDKTVDFDLSEAGESFFDQSLISNVSQIFGKEEFPYEKQLKRNEQVRLFQKTASYIKSLKNAIEQKNKKIKLLQRKIDSLRNSELIRKDIYEVREAETMDYEGEFKDYYSVQLQYKSHSNLQKYKQLEHETKLAIEENNLLMNQIESMQEELMKAEEQENSLVKIKDLYKEEIKKLIKKNEEQAKMFEDQMKVERKKVEDSESVHNFEVLKQLFVKIMATYALIESEGPKSKKREERKKELKGFAEVFCSIIGIQAHAKEKILADILK